MEFVEILDDSPRSMAHACLMSHIQRRKVDKLEALGRDLGYKVAFGMFGNYGVTVYKSETECVDFPSVGRAEKWLRYRRRVAKANKTLVNSVTRRNEFR